MQRWQPDAHRREVWSSLESHSEHVMDTEVVLPVVLPVWRAL